MLDATDKHLVPELLLRYNKEQDELIEKLRKDLTEVEKKHLRLANEWRDDRFTEDAAKKLYAKLDRERKQKVDFLTMVVWGAIVPIALASIAVLFEVVVKGLGSRN